MARRGIHTKPNKGHSVEWITPPELIRSLGEFDLDPCAHPKQFYRTAKTMICPPDDGLAVGWHGQRVWLNPPYGQHVIDKWLSKLAEHGNGIALVPARTEVEAWFWPYIWEAADAVLFRRGRVWFRMPDGTRRGNAGHGSVLAAYGKRNATILRRAGIAGYFLSPASGVGHIISQNE